MTPVDTVILYQYVEMIDIDEIVMRECAKHMRDTAGDSLDNYVGDNYRIYAEDCIPRLEKYKNEGKVFDVVINDLTGIEIYHFSLV